jgi:hypothetical protein
VDGYYYGSGEIRRGFIDWIDLAQDRNWRMENTVRNLRVPKNVGEFLSSCRTATSREGWSPWSQLLRAMNCLVVLPGKHHISDMSSQHNRAVAFGPYRSVNGSSSDWDKGQPNLPRMWTPHWEHLGFMSGRSKQTL